MIYLEDDDVAAVSDGALNIHRMEMNESNVRELITLKLELEQIMKGELMLYLTHRLSGFLNVYDESTFIAR